MANETHQQSATMADIIIQNSLFKNGQFPNQLNYLGCDNNFKGEMTYENLEEVRPKIIAYKQFPNKRDAYEIYPFFVYHSPGNKNETISDILNIDQLMYLSGKKSLDSGTKFIELTSTNNYQLGLSNNYYRLGILLFDLIENGSYTNLIYNNTDEHPACWQISILPGELTTHKSLSLSEILGYFGYTTPEDKSEIWQKICGIDGTPRCLIIGLYQYVQNEMDTAFLGNYNTILESCKIKIHYTNYQLTDDNQNNYEKQVNELITVNDVSSLNNTSLSNSSTYISVPTNYRSEIYHDHDIPHIQLEKEPNEIHIYDYYRNYITNYNSFADALDNNINKGVIRSDTLKTRYKDCLENSFYFDIKQIKYKYYSSGYEITLNNICQDQKDFPIQKYQFFSEESNNLDISIYCHFILSYWGGWHSDYTELMPLNSSCTLAACPLTYNILTNSITNKTIFIPEIYNKWVGRFSDWSGTAGEKLSLYVIPFQISTRKDEGNKSVRLGDSNVYYHKIVYNPDVIK